MLYKDVGGVFEWGALQGDEALTDPPCLFPLPLSFSDHGGKAQCPLLGKRTLPGPL